MSAQLKLTYGTNKGVVITVASQRPEEQEELTSAIIEAAFDAHVKLGQFRAVCLVVLGGLAVVVGMAWFRHIGTAAAVGLNAFLMSSLMFWYHRYGMAYDAVSKLLQKGRIEYP